MMRLVHVLVIGMLSVSWLDGVIGRRPSILLSYAISMTGIALLWRPKRADIFAEQPAPALSADTVRARLREDVIQTLVEVCATYVDCEDGREYVVQRL